ncbi:hypothetical protein CERSUDRAFT_74897 [Gelatoporia subvermispora B]|uniref:Uncharacterized protein n=1 Tax=Ceriporiopsis subvermispora (strain B) TaxID=914234 RepID=M2R9Z2_CERS8|nr:hypothetical protein CERSUDRAFT_74897 [Gelatoporia subvermispora B]
MQLLESDRSAIEEFWRPPAATQSSNNSHTNISLQSHHDGANQQLWGMQFRMALAIARSWPPPMAPSLTNLAPLVTTEDWNRKGHRTAILCTLLKAKFGWDAKTSVLAN